MFLGVTMQFIGIFFYDGHVVMWYILESITAE